MADVQELKCWPLCVNSIDWSADGTIALAADERVELLFPHIVFYDEAQQDFQWRHVSLRVTLWSMAELPDQEPSSMSVFSIGEEESASHPIRISWSPPGIAKHRRCCLGVLTSNLALSLWSTEGEPSKEDSWDRRLLINDSLADYFAASNVLEENHFTSDNEEKIVLRSRIRAFAWAPSPRDTDVSGIIGTKLEWPQNLLAVANDDNHIVILVIDTPTTTLGADNTWNVGVLKHFSISAKSEDKYSDPFIFEDIVMQQRHVSQISWSPWAVHGDCWRSVLAYATNEDVRARTLEYRWDTIILGDEVVYLNNKIRNVGMMKWSRNVEDNKLTLALFPMSTIICLSISAIDASIIKRTTHDLNSRWDETSGVVWDEAPESTRLHFSSISSTVNSSEAVLEYTAGKLKPLLDAHGGADANWWSSIRDKQGLFSARHDLHGNARSMVWGLTQSPLGDFIASCSSAHPSDMIEHGPPNDRRVTIAIHNLRSYHKTPLRLPATEVSAEAMLMTLRKRMENTVEELKNIPKYIEKVHAQLVEAYPPPNNPKNTRHNAAYSANSKDLAALATHFKINAVLSPHVLKHRYTILISQLSNPAPPIDLPRTLIAYHLAAAAQALPISLFHPTSFSARILTQHRKLTTLIQDLISEEDKTEKHQQQNKQEPQEPPSSPPPLDSLTTSTCDICTAPIPFTDLTQATCTSGHAFPRCGISFLPIQAPLITKYCGICGAMFLAEEFVRGQEDEVEEDVRVAEGDEVPEPARRPVTLARVLFAACDVCVYCGGKFVG